MTQLTLIVRDEENGKDEKYRFVSEIENNNVFEARAHDIANILEYDKNQYNDVNIETIVRAATIAGIIKEG
jgi:hypothetical protein